MKRESMRTEDTSGALFRDSRRSCPIINVIVKRGVDVSIPVYSLVSSLLNVRTPQKYP